MLWESTLLTTVEFERQTPSDPRSAISLSFTGISLKCTQNKRMKLGVLYMGIYRFPENSAPQIKVCFGNLDSDAEESPVSEKIWTLIYEHHLLSKSYLGFCGLFFFFCKSQEVFITVLQKPRKGRYREDSLPWTRRLSPFWTSTGKQYVCQMGQRKALFACPGSLVISASS